MISKKWAKILANHRYFVYNGEYLLVYARNKIVKYSEQDFDKAVSKILQKDFRNVC